MSLYTPCGSDTPLVSLDPLEVGGDKGLPLLDQPGKNAGLDPGDSLLKQDSDGEIGGYKAGS